MDYDACITDIAGHVEAAGRRNGQRWIVDRGALRTILEHYFQPAPESEPEAEPATTEDDADDS